ncbi:hypothetical protein CCH79_00006789 [Gambusia affinis]|uniref:Arrestin C-terminal-like domain-containing protein n=1 Tax=Gambusia affinis TaxID=33528 RepID=A0A315VC80_GAMAF|nr:hypothetical protein CCH79_00006789 [Gambusia affinis]
MPFQARQHGTMNKNIALGSGKVSMSVHTRQRGYKQGKYLLTMSLHCIGEALRVRLEIENLSSRSVKPKFVLDEKKSYFGINRSKIQKHEILKEKTDAVESFSGKKTVIKEIAIPRELSPSILNCSIIKLEYRLKVYLEITCGTDLVVKLPIVIIPELSEEDPSGRPNQPAWMSQPMGPPPPYEEYTICQENAFKRIDLLSQGFASTVGCCPVMTVKHFSVEYDRVKDQGTYSPGDILSGKVTVVTTKEIKVQSFLVRAKGKAKVTWYEQEGQNSVVRSNKKKYFYFEHIILQDKNKGDGSEIMGAGINVFPFSFVIPSRDMPSSYKGKSGEITYSLRAHLTQSIWLVHKTKTEFPFLTSSEFPFASKSEMIIIGLKVTMNVTSEKMGLKQGEAMGVFVEVLNESGHSVTPKFYLCEKLTFVAHSKKKVETKVILFGIGDAVPAESSHTVTKVLIIPPHLPATFFNCSMINLEYRIKITLGVPLLRDAEIKLPLVILQELSTEVWPLAPPTAVARTSAMTTMWACRRLPVFLGHGCHGNSPRGLPQISGMGVQLTNPLPAGERLREREKAGERSEGEGRGGCVCLCVIWFLHRRERSDMRSSRCPYSMGESACLLRAARSMPLAPW